jgi:putative ABC transport system permease protein
MSALRQVIAATAIAVGGLRERCVPALVIVVGMSCVVGVLTSMLSVTAGLMGAYLRPEDATRAVVWADHAEFEQSRSLKPDDIATIFDAPGIAKGGDGTLLADPEFLMWVPLEGFSPGSLQLLGMGAAGAALRPGFTILAGHAPRPGRREVVVGAGAARKFGLRTGDQVRLRDGSWPIVGVFSCDGDITESYLVGDADTVMAARRASGFAHVFVQLVSSSAYPEFKRWLEQNPAIKVSVELKSEYDRRVVGETTGFFTRMSYMIALIMAVGALFGVVKIMYAAVRVRTHEIGTLRALGFGAAPVAVSVILEAALLGMAGAVLGTAIAWAVFDGRQMWVWGAFTLRVPWQLWALGLSWAIATAILGGIFPALRAARLSPAEALRAE